MRFAVYLGTATLLMMPLQSTRLDTELYSFGEGEGDVEAASQIDITTSADADADAEAEAEMEAMIEADAKLASTIHAMVEGQGIWADMKDTVSGWGEDLKKGWEQLKLNARGTNLTTLSRFLSDKMAGMTAWQSFAHDYTDHVATSEYPMNLKDFFYQSTFYHGKGDWETYN